MRRIIITCDGIGQSSSRGANTVPTNVTRLCRALISTPDAPKIVFYQSGVGTQDLGWGPSMGMALGSGIEDSVVDGYTFLMNNYHPGDKIVIFGFSSGAFASAHSCQHHCSAGRWKAYSWAFKDAMNAYQLGELGSYIIDKVKKMTPTKGEHFKTKELTPWAYDVEFEVIGCWGTVTSLGVPWQTLSNPGVVSGQYSNYDGGLVKGIKNAFHALVLDE